MKRLLLVISLCILASLACRLPFDSDQQRPGDDGATQDEHPPAGISEHRCGDGVCDGPENTDICPADCVLQGSDQEEAVEQPPSTEAAREQTFLGQVYAEVHVQRQDGEGSCGSPPWGVDHIDGGDFNCPPPKYWYGYDLVATALQIVQITPAGGDNWQISGQKLGGGTYQKAEHWSDGQRICSPESIEGDIFDFEVQGMYQNEQIELQLSARPTEVSNWSCEAGNSYQRETTLLLIDWSIAMTGDTSDLTAVLSKTDTLAAGIYLHEYMADMNPSPENRDHAEASLEFRCIESAEDGVYKAVACPWE